MKITIEQLDGSVQVITYGQESTVKLQLYKEAGEKVLMIKNDYYPIK